MEWSRFAYRALMLSLIITFLVLIAFAIYS
jgi:hypothetical protein